MSDRIDTLLLEFLDLARGQRIALKEGDIDAAVELLEKRRGILGRIQAGGRVKHAPVIEQIHAIDEDLRKTVMAGMSEVASSLDSLGKLRSLLKTSDMLGKDNKARMIV
jgi:hypothetical protein